LKSFVTWFINVICPLAEQAAFVCRQPVFAYYRIHLVEQQPTDWLLYVVVIGS
jgi:hypothetical protein